MLLAAVDCCELFFAHLFQKIPLRTRVDFFFSGYTQGYTAWSSAWTAIASASNVLSTTPISLKLYPNAYTLGA